MGEKESTNGTFLNGQAHRFLRDKEYPIADGDTLQIGRTKIVLKTKQTVKNDVEAAKMVQDMDYEKTIIH
jgi:pSer/pThr/pTyr-binding forkhead associated (FHA) protein